MHYVACTLATFAVLTRSTHKPDAWPPSPPAALPRRLKDQLIAAKIIRDVINDVAPIKGLDMETKFQLAGGALLFSVSCTVATQPVDMDGLWLAGTLFADRVGSGATKLPCRVQALLSAHGRPCTPGSMPSPAPQNGQLLPLADVANPPTLAITGARPWDKFVLFVVDPDAPEPVGNFRL